MRTSSDVAGGLEKLSVLALARGRLTREQLTELLFAAAVNALNRRLLQVRGGCYIWAAGLCVTGSGLRLVLARKLAWVERAWLQTLGPTALGTEARLEQCAFRHQSVLPITCEILPLSQGVIELVDPEKHGDWTLLGWWPEHEVESDEDEYEEASDGEGAGGDGGFRRVMYRRYVCTPLLHMVGEETAEAFEAGDRERGMDGLQVLSAICAKRPSAVLDL